MGRASAPPPAPPATDMFTNSHESKDFLKRTSLYPEASSAGLSSRYGANLRRIQRKSVRQVKETTEDRHSCCKGSCLTRLGHAERGKSISGPILATKFMYPGGGQTQARQRRQGGRHKQKGGTVRVQQCPSLRDEYHLSQARAVLESNMSLISERRRRPGSSSNPPPPFPAEGGASNTSKRLRLIPWRRCWEGVLASRPPSAPASAGALSSNVMPASGGPGYT